jgi:HNH endonuclease
MTKEILTQENLKQHLHYDLETGLFTRIKKVSNLNIGDMAGGLQLTGYINIGVNGKPYSAHRLAWLYVYGEFPISLIDHINGIKTDNRICNLREASRAQNAQNAKIWNTNKSGFKGVFWLASRNRWIANIILNGKKIRIGSFKNIELAVEERKKYAKLKHGEFYRE